MLPADFDWCVCLGGHRQLVFAAFACVTGPDSQAWGIETLLAANSFCGGHTQEIALPATLPSGLYKIAFETPSGTEYGVAYLQDGKLRGGDSGMAYVGSYSMDGS